jgi:large subunit ribosomal protein L31
VSLHPLVATAILVNVMKKGIHPNYRLVVFRDVSCDFQFISKSCVETRETVEIDGTTYPLFAMDISSASHPFYTGTQKIMDTAGRIDRFYKKYGFTRTEA